MIKRDLTAETAEDKSDISDEARTLGIDAYKLRANRAVNNRLVRDIVSDFRAPISQSTSMIPPARRDPPPPKGSGWQDAAPIKPPTGIKYVDQMCEAQNRADKAAAIRRRLKDTWVEQLLDDGDDE